MEVIVIYPFDELSILGELCTIAKPEKDLRVLNLYPMYLHKHMHS